MYGDSDFHFVMVWKFSAGDVFFRSDTYLNRKNKQ